MTHCPDVVCGGRYLLLVILGDVAEELTGLPEQDVLLAELFLQEFLQHKV